MFFCDTATPFQNWHFNSIPFQMSHLQNQKPFVFSHSKDFEIRPFHLSCHLAAPAHKLMVNNWAKEKKKTRRTPICLLCLVVFPQGHWLIWSEPYVMEWMKSKAGRTTTNRFSQTLEGNIILWPVNRGAGVPSGAFSCQTCESGIRGEKTFRKFSKENTKKFEKNFKKTVLKDEFFGGKNLEFVWKL